MKNACASTHNLYIASRSSTLIAAIIFMGDRAFANISDNFHITMRVGVEPCMRCNPIIIDD